jgi:hypothetical protein
MTAEEKIEFLAGQVHGLIGFCSAIINDHPSPARLSRWLDESEQLNLAHVESTLVREEYLYGLRDVMDRLQKAVANARARQTRPTQDR